MKHAILFLLLSFTVKFSFAQNSDRPQEVTPAVKQKLVAEINKQAEGFKKSLAKKNLNQYEIEYSVDTFKIDRLIERERDIDPSTAGQIFAIDESIKGYDALINKYYKLLLGILDEEDKKTLIAAQRAWITFRDAEAKLRGLQYEKKYTGGGSMYAVIRVSDQAELIERRATELYNYYEYFVVAKKEQQEAQGN